MAQRVPEGERYPSRAADVIPLSLTMDREAVQLARRHAVGPGAIGRYLSRLLYEDEARRSERERMQREPAQG